MKKYIRRALCDFVHKSVWFDYTMFALLILAIWKFTSLMFFYLGDYVFNLVVMFAYIFILGNMITGWIKFQIYIEVKVPKK